MTNRATWIIGALFFFYGCAGRAVEPWNLRDIQSLDAHVMNTKNWLKRHQGDNKDLQRILRKEMERYMEQDLRVHEQLESVSARMNGALETVKRMIGVQIKMATLIKRQPRLKVFGEEPEAVEPDTSNEDGEKKRGLFKRRKRKDEQDPVSVDPLSEKAASIRSELENNSITIIEAQGVYLEGKEKMVELFDQNDMRLIYVRDQALSWKYEINGLRYERAQLDPRIAAFQEQLDQALFRSQRSAYTKRVSGAAKTIEGYEKTMDRFDDYVQGIERTAKKEAKRMVYTMPNGETKKYEKKYRKGLTKYKGILFDLREVLESV